MVGGSREAFVTESHGKDRNPGSESTLEESAPEGEKIFSCCGCSFGEENDGLSSLKASADLPKGGVEGGELISGNEKCPGPSGPGADDRPEGDFFLGDKVAGEELANEKDIHPGDVIGDNQEGAGTRRGPLDRHVHLEF